jgi:hypothetical protein
VINFMRERAAGSRRATTALVAAVIGPAAAGLLWGAAMAAQAGDPPPQPSAADANSGAPAASQVKPDPLDRVICRHEEPMIGTKIGPARVCHTKREWNQMAKDEDEQRFRSRDPSIVTRGDPGVQITH